VGLFCEVSSRYGNGSKDEFPVRSHHSVYRNTLHGVASRAVESESESKKNVPTPSPTSV
jgi:hypothetical protein